MERCKRSLRSIRQKANLLVTKKSIKVKNWEKDKGLQFYTNTKVDKGKYCKKPVNGNGLAKALKT